MQPHSEELILAITRVLPSTQICATIGDARMFELLSNYYALVANEVSASGGRVIKVMGDTTLLTFPMREPRAVVEPLRTLQVKANALWQQVDANSRVQVKVGIGQVVVGSLDQRLDVVGSALNRLFKAPWSDFEVLPELAGLI
jgi:class 3 adenylate cyclase